jgi:hypothetical protein
LTWYIRFRRRPDDRDEDAGRKAVDKKAEVGYEGGMTENTQAVDLVQELLAATFGPNTAAEVAKDEGVSAHDVETTPLPSGSSSGEDDGAVGPSDLPHTSTPDGADAEVAALPRWWKFNLDGTPRKRCQAPEVLKGIPHGETRQRETDLLLLKALHEGCETLIELVAHTTFVKVTVVRGLERLVEAGRVVQSKAAPSGKRGRPAFVYRPTTETPVEAPSEAV